jgi:hypothetical protein
MHKYIVPITLLVLFFWGCNENQNIPATPIKPSDDSLNSISVLSHSQGGALKDLMLVGISEIEKYRSLSSIHIGKQDSIVLASTSLTEGVKLLHPGSAVNIQKKLKRSNCNTISLKHNRDIGYYFECLSGLKQQPFYLILAKQTDSNAIIIPIESGKEILNSFFFLDYRSGKCLNFSFKNFWSMNYNGLSLESLNTISYLNAGLYEKYMMYFLNNKLKFSVYSEYGEYCRREDQISIPDSTFDRTHARPKGIYYLSGNISITELLKQDNLNNGIPILRYFKDMGNENLPAWCLKNKIY